MSANGGGRFEIRRRPRSTVGLLASSYAVIGLTSWK